MKEKLVEALGSFGLILFWLLSFLFVAIPIWATNLPFLAMLVIFAILYFTNLIGALLTILVYVYSTFVVLSSPINWFSIVFFIDMALYIIFCFIPSIAQIISIAKENRRN